MPSNVVPVLLAVALAAVSGFGDAIAYLRWHQFAANMTGNTVLLGIAATHRTWLAVGISFAPIASFIAGCALAQIAERARPLAILTAIACVVGASLAGRQRVQVDLLAAAMGITNSSVAKFGGVQANTSFVTGDYGLVAKAATRLALRRAQEHDRETVIVIVPLIAAYALSAAVAALLVEHRVAHALFAVVPVLAAVAWYLARRP